MSSTLTLSELVELCRNRWSVPVLANLHLHSGARFVELVNRLELPRDSLARTLAILREAGWIQPNAGHGHPLRPEYVLTSDGKQVGKTAARILTVQAELGLAPGALTCWGLPLIRQIRSGQNRFNTLIQGLAPVSPRAVSQGLRALAQHDLVVRELVDGFPPVSRYDLTREGRHLASAA